MPDQDLPDLDETIIQLPEDFRESLANRGKNDLLFFVKAILGYRDVNRRTHGALCAFHDHHPSQFKLTLMPRGHFKTSCLTIGKNAQKIVRNTNERILLANETSTNAERFLSAIRQHAESNKVFRALYSDIIPKNTRGGGWSSKELIFNRQWTGPEPTIDTGGMTGALTSRHYTHLSIDDAISEEAAKSNAVMQDTITRIDKIVSLMVKPGEDTFDLTGTRWAIFDIYSYFMKIYGPKMARFIRAAIEDGEPIFPEFFSLETLAQARTNMGEYMFSCLYMNNPRDIVNQDFNIQDLRFWRWSMDQEAVILYDGEGEIIREVPVGSLDITVTIDLAVSEKITSDRNAVVACGVTRKGEVIVLDAWARRCTPLEVIEHLFQLKRRFNVRAFGVEGVIYQKAFKYFLKAECDRRNEYMNIVELKAIPSRKGTGSNSKEMRIRGLQPIAATGRLYVLPTQHILRNEMADFPLGEHDDALDALAHQLVMFRDIMSPDRLSKYQESERALLRRLRSEQEMIPTTEWDPDFDEDPRFGQVTAYTT
jgi:predicted phage terminase large subunit-like protein